ncbi:hypothetical protein MLD38_023127 [Melastoma candidum]|uniref:Uncharacterized protein n=1 Tax=Melastoma candidum TaxID=119954 RepID=A0ACB9QQH1_9MYRT|nr:hypothetical protein MLD38_023127 [Melastoma candidum]
MIKAPRFPDLLGADFGAPTRLFELPYLDRGSGSAYFCTGVSGFFLVTNAALGSFIREKSLGDGGVVRRLSGSDEDCFSALMAFLSNCFRSRSDSSSRNGLDTKGRQDGLLWYKDNGKHLHGDFSMAVVQANNLLEDQCQLESGSLSLNQNGPRGTFVGVYDGHGGPETARYVNDHLFQHLKRLASGRQSLSTDVIRKAFQATEEGFLSVVSNNWPLKPQLAAVGSCCLVGIVSDGNLYIANLGDSRAVLGRVGKASGKVTAVQLSTEHNANIESVRRELCSEHPDDSKIVVLKNNVWRVKGIIQVSKAIGDVYLKKPEFNKEPLYEKFLLREPFEKSILSSDPSILVHQLEPCDRFVIFASDGLWEHLGNQEAVDIVSSHSRNGIAKQLVKAALQEAARKREMRYADLKKITRGVRRHFHDDVTVVVVFLDSAGGSDAWSRRYGNVSVRGGGVKLPPNSLAPFSVLG